MWKHCVSQKSILFRESFMERLKSSAVLGREEIERSRGKGNLPTDSFTLQDMKTRKTLKEKKMFLLKDC